jgi:hypothetical protein
MCTASTVLPLLSTLESRKNDDPWGRCTLLHTSINTYSSRLELYYCLQGSTTGTRVPVTCTVETTKGNFATVTTGSIYSVIQYQI